MKRKTPQTDLTDPQWRLIEPHFPKPKPDGRPRSSDIRCVFNAILYVNRTGCAWRMLPGDFPPWKLSGTTSENVETMAHWKH